MARAPCLLLGAFFILLAVVGYGFKSYRSLHARLLRSEENFEKLQNQHDSMVSQTRVLQEHKSRLETRLQSDQQQHKQAMEDLQKDKQMAIDKLTVAKEYLFREKNMLRENVRQLEAEKAKVSESLAAAQAEAQKCADNVDQSYAQANSNLSQLKQECNNEIAQFKDKVANLERRNAELVNKLSAALEAKQGDKVQSMRVDPPQRYAHKEQNANFQIPQPIGDKEDRESNKNIDPSLQHPVKKSDSVLQPADDGMTQRQYAADTADANQLDRKNLAITEELPQPEGASRLLFRQKVGQNQIPGQLAINAAVQPNKDNSQPREHLQMGKAGVRQQGDPANIHKTRDNARDMLDNRIGGPLAVVADNMLASNRLAVAGAPVQQVARPIVEGDKQLVGHEVNPSEPNTGQSQQQHAKPALPSDSPGVPLGPQVAQHIHLFANEPQQQIHMPSLSVSDQQQQQHFNMPGIAVNRPAVVLSPGQNQPNFKGNDGGIVGRAGAQEVNIGQVRADQQQVAGGRGEGKEGEMEEEEEDGEAYEAPRD